MKIKTIFKINIALIFLQGLPLFISLFSPEFKIDFCSNLIWINDEEIFHHSKMLDHDGNVWISGQKNPKSKYVKKFENKWSKWLGVKYSVFVNSGSSANLVTISILKMLYKKNEIILPSLTWVSDVNSVILNNQEIFFKET